jgi:MFS transporter, ACS family, glucarate transporter
MFIRRLRPARAMIGFWKSRHGVVALLVLLFGITYLDRVCISVAGPRMQQDLHIGPIGWGWVTGAFTISYCLFEIPSGILADRIGPRRVLTRIVLWWSAFTALTGAVTGYYPLLVTRFLFGAGEAGAFPSAGAVISRWFPPSRRATMSGVTLMASQIGGALAPLLVVPIQSRYGWRASFYVFGVLGACWAIAWYVWFRDSPNQGKTAEQPEHREAAEALNALRPIFPWRAALRSRSVLAMLGAAFCYVYVYNFFQTWFHTFLVNGRGFSEAGLLISALPYVVAVFSNLTGGAASDALVRKLGAKRGRRAIGVTALTVAGLFTVAAMVSRHQILTVVFLAVVYGAITFQQSGVFGVCLDIGQRHAGAMVGLMNTSSQIGGLVGSVAYGYIVERFGSYDAPFVPMAALLFLGALLWLRIDASEELRAAP